jgi:Asp-tRNA(Asn)/Glu-tRNA(Gln) amidotransferase C subunit
MKLDQLLNKKTLLSTYVHVGAKIIDATVNPINKFMKHLLIVQGLDPNAQPGAAYRARLIKAIDQVDDSKEFDDDFDFSWVGKSFFKAKSNLNGLNVNKSEFQRMTDLSHFDDSPIKMEPLQVAKNEINDYCENVAARTIPDLSTTQGRSDYRRKVVESFKNENHLKDEIGSDSITKLKGALEALVKYADKYDEEVKKETVTLARQPNALSDSKKAKKPIRVNKSFKKGSFRRVD